tara:strand:+ start:1770 stop:3728 length:1959 start_codon:yes stop_codon:yes gene_type:complete
MAEENKKNPRNPTSELYKRLTKLFSGPIVSRRTQTGRRIRKQQLDKYGHMFKSASGQEFKRAHYNPFESMNSNYMANQNRTERYVDSDQMEYTPEIASALDIYADEMTTSSPLAPMLQIKCPNEEIKAILNTVYNDILNVKFNLFGWARTMCKYGDFFLYLDVDETYGIRHAIGLPPNEVERLEGEDKTNPNYIQFQWNSAGMTFENWQMAHFRILGNDKYHPYGTSVLEPARRIWRQLTLMEDAMMAYRIVRAPARKAFYVDVGNIPPQDVEQYMQRVITAMKRNQVVNSDTGRVDLRYNPLSIEEDYYIPVRGGTKFADIQEVGGQERTHDIDDVKYLRDKLFSALKVPASYLTQGEEGSEDKTTLATKDIRFARTVQRLQRSLIAELEKIGIVHLHTLGFRGDDLVNFSLSLNNPSKIAEIQELEHWNQKFSIATNATEGFFSKRWISEHLFAMSEEQFMRNKREMYHDRKFEAELNAVGEAAGQAAAGAAMGMPEVGGGLPEMPGGFEAGGALPGAEEPTLPGEEPAGAAPEAPEGEAEASPLLATPGKRDRDFRWTNPDKRKQDGRKSSGPRAKSYKRMATPESMIGSTTRSVHPGYSELSAYSKGIYAEQVSNYEEEEERIFSINRETQRLIENLNSMESKTDEAQ